MIMSPDNNIVAKQGGGNKDETTQSSGGGGGRKTSSMGPPEQALKCPRCDSPNTKFCYYNNYSLTQPRHFCKTCRRYWTKDGALRNVPIGGGCRKNKKMIKSSSSSRFSGHSSSKDLCSDIGGLKFFNGLSPAMDFQLGGLNFTPPPPRLNHHHSSNFAAGAVYNNTSSYGETSNPNCFNLDNNPLGFNFPLSSHVGGGISGFQEMGITSNIHNSSLASSIESLSSINQDLHWKLQQQRLAMLFGGGENQQKESSISLSPNIVLKKPQPILFENLEISKPGGGGGYSRKDGCSSGGDNLATEWFFDNSYAPVNVSMNMNINPAPTDHSNSTGNENGGSNWNGIQAWNNLNQYSALP